MKTVRTNRARWGPNMALELPLQAPLSWKLFLGRFFRLGAFLFQELSSFRTFLLPGALFSQGLFFLRRFLLTEAFSLRRSLFLVTFLY
jgi:hypothetical protein